MSINLYGNIGTTYTGIVTGAELERVSQEIFGGAQVKASEKTSQATQQTTQVQTQTPADQINLYTRSTDINLTQQVAQAKADFNVQLSPQALQNIQALNILAALDYGLIRQTLDTISLVQGNVPQANVHLNKAMAIFEMVFEDEPVLLEQKRQEMDGMTSPVLQSIRKLLA